MIVLYLIAWLLAAVVAMSLAVYAVVDRCGTCGVTAAALALVLAGIARWGLESMMKGLGP